MAITRFLDKKKQIVTDKRLPWTYAESGGAISTFVADVSANPNNVHNATYRVHTFDSVGSHSITFSHRGFLDILVIAGGGGGGAAYNSTAGSGGGAGGLLQRYGIVVDAGTVDIFVGAGATTQTNSGNRWDGEDSYFSVFKAIGGGSGQARYHSNGHSGGSGGGNQETVSGCIPDQGNLGGITLNSSAGAGGGGAGEAGGSPQGDIYSFIGSGGNGLAVAFKDNQPTYYSGGGAGAVRGTYTSPLPTGGLGGGGGLGGSPGGNWTGANATFFGGGGGGGDSVSNNNYWYKGGNGYQGIVMVRYIINGE